MQEENNDSLPLEGNGSNSDRKVTYHHFGKLAAKNTNANPASIESSLDNIYERFLTEQQLNEDGINQRIAKLRAEIIQKKNQKSNINAEVTSLQQTKEEKENRIEEYEIEKIKIKDGDGGSTDYVPFVIGAFIVILLTLYLFVFYSSSGYSAFYGVKPGNLGFINPNVFTEAQSKGGGLIAMIILFPVIFLGLGFLIHDALEKRKYLFITALLLFTLFVDAIIGYKIAQAIHTNEFNAGTTNDLWEFRMIYYDINFYLIIALGFIVYVIWGALLHYVLNKYRELQPDKAIEIRIENLNRKIAELRQVLTELTFRINTLKAQIETIQNEIEDKEKEVIGYENGSIPVNIPLLQASVGDFMNGWFAYATLMYPYDAIRRTEEAMTKQKAWIDRKISDLQNEK